MCPVRILIVDDSVVVRRVLTDALSADPTLEVVGSAATAAIALQKLSQISPDVVILDVEMPGMDGVEAVKHIRAGWPRLPVIMCSSLTERGADTTLRALANGASDYVAKPSSLRIGDSDAMAEFKTELRAKVKALGDRPSDPPAALPNERAPAYRGGVPRAASPTVSALAIGCSTGGPNALAKVFEALPRDLPVPIFIVQHMPPLFTKLLADRLAASSGLSVVEAAEGMIPEAGSAYVAPGDYHMTVVREGHTMRIRLNQQVPENSCRPAVDVLFRSLACAYGSGVQAAVMTGMGHDGARGARAIVDAGGSVIVQDAASSVVPSMPGAVVSAGLADGVFPLGELAHELVVRVKRGQSTPAVAVASRPPEVRP